MMQRKPVTAIVQARLASERLPGKVLLPLGGKPILHHVLERTRAMEGIDHIILATGNPEENRELILLAEEMGIESFAGSDNNVLERFVLAARPHSPEFVVRITADNPFVDVEYGSMAVEIARESKPDLSSVIHIPLGTALEVISFQALEMSLEGGHEEYHFEHVTPFIKEHQELFRIERYPVEIDNPFNELRLTVDTPSDYHLAETIYDNLYNGKPFPLSKVISFLKTRTHLLELNRNIVQRSMTHSANVSP
jgi:spore coat polysaccharide biosynthesis protein SpsF